VQLEQRLIARLETASIRFTDAQVERALQQATDAVIAAANKEPGLSGDLLPITPRYRSSFSMSTGKR
jgi:hypothetical protein